MKDFIDSNGKIGVGGAPSAWQAATTSNVLQLGTACLFNYNNDYFHVGQNFYYDGSNYKYVAMIQQLDYYKIMVNLLSIKQRQVQ